MDIVLETKCIYYRPQKNNDSYWHKSVRIDVEIEILIQIAPIWDGETMGPD